MVICLVTLSIVFIILSVKDPKFARFYLLPKIHKRLHDVPGRPVISNCGFYTENRI